MENLPNKLSAEVINGVVFIKVVGALSETVLEQRHELMLRCADATGAKRVLFDVRGAKPPSEEARGLQQKLNSQFSVLGLKLAVVVSDTRMAFLARQTFFGLHHHVVYDDVEIAATWLRGLADSN